MSGLFASDRALSPAVAIMLLLSLTVILGATVAMYVSGLGEKPTEAPSAAFEFSYDSAGSSDAIGLKHKAGDRIDADNLNVVVTGVTCQGGTDDPNGRYNIDDDFRMGPPDMAAGMTVQYGPDIDLDGTKELCPGGTLSIEGATFRVVWEAPNGNTIELRTWSA